MARYEQDREDLLREATALIPRGEWIVAGEREPVVVGFRSNGALSVYFGGDPVYQLDGENRLRRAFCDGHLYRSQGTRLACLVRQRTDTETILHRTDLSPEAQQVFLELAQRRLRGLTEALRTGKVQIVGQVPVEYDLRAAVLSRLSSIEREPLRLAPALPTRRN